MIEKIPDGITPEHIKAAMDALDSGAIHDFAASTGYDLVHEGKRYPPKAVLGIAAGLKSGHQLGPYDFKGGLKSNCFRIIEENGFGIKGVRVV